MTDVRADSTLDASGDVCPMPILKTKKAMDGLASGQVLKMISTDPGSNQDVIAWCQRTGNELIHTEQSGNQFIYYIKKK